MTKQKMIAGDMLASVVVFLVALPLCMGIAMASGVPPAYGLVTGIIGGLIVGLLAGSPLQVSGPAAGLAVIVWELVQKHGVEALGAIVLIAGTTQLIAGLLRVGQWFRAVSPAVIHGMLAGIGVLIFSSQFHIMLDSSPKGRGISNLISIPEAAASDVFTTTTTPHQSSALIGILTISVMMLWNRYKPKALKALPAPLIGVLAGAGAAAALGLNIKFVDVPQNLAASLNTLSFASLFDALAQPAVIISGLAVALIASAETLLCAAAVDKMHAGVRTNYDRELAAQGVGNMLCGALGVLPMTGVIVRSSANVDAGAQTRWSAVMHGVWILLFVAAMPGVLKLIPISSLAAVLVYTGVKLVNIGAVKRLLEVGRAQVAIYLITLGTIVATDLLTGVIVGFAAAILKVLHDRSLLDVRLENQGDKSVLHLAGTATFFRIPRLARALESVPQDKLLEVRIDQLQYIDDACLELINGRKATGGRIEAPWEELRRRCNRPSLEASA